jgi:hypothetical protein
MKEKEERGRKRKERILTSGVKDPMWQWKELTRFYTAKEEKEVRRGRGEMLENSSRMPGCPHILWSE